ncbi:MAG: hypothetical protein ACTHX2_01705 [Microbacterium sp.]
MKRKARRTRTFWSVFLLVLLCQTVIFSISVAGQTWGTTAATANIIAATTALVALVVWASTVVNRRRRARVDSDAGPRAQ